MHQPDPHRPAPFCNAESLDTAGSVEIAAHTYGFAPLIPAEPPAREPASAREARLAGLARMRANLLHQQLRDAPRRRSELREGLARLRAIVLRRQRDTPPRWAALRDGGLLPDDNARMGATVVACLVLAGVIVIVRYAGWV